MCGKSLFLVLASVAFLFAGNSVFAQITNTATGTTTDEKERSRATIQEKKDGIRTNVEEKKESLKDRREALSKEIKDRLKARIRGFVQQMERRLGAAIERMEKIAERIASRIEKIKVTGIDTTEAETYLGAMKTDISEAKALVGKIPEAIEESLLAEEMRKAFENVKTIIEEAKREIQSAHDNAKKAIGSLMEMVKESQSDASTTPSIN